MSVHPLWIDLEGAANVRDLGGLPAVDGRTVAPRRLVRSDNLQGLTPSDIGLLVDDVGVRAVADLRTSAELSSEGPGPLTQESRVRIEHFSLYPEAGEHTDVVADESEPVLLPWQIRERQRGERRDAAAIYQRYLEDRPDSVVAALRLIAESDGATIVHCAAGKDRTGVVVALALDEVGVERDAIVDDFVRSGERMKQILTRLAASRTYADDIRGVPFEKHLPRPETMKTFLTELDEIHGGTATWLRKHGWTDSDASALGAALLTE